ncbi:hypothetical protein [Streptomyces sp. NPDC006012]|uniref:hypothetical protein n=1 Tax=Streptomyces sp. NPDC006012 TaxID=3364739 RepID=UPI0036C1F099
MSHRIARRLLEPLLRLFLPGTGRRRRSSTTSREWEEDRPAVTAPVGAGGPAPRKETHPLCGEDHALVRPYLLAHERRQDAQRQEVRRQRARRRALWLAVHGIDVGPRVIHGVEVSA